MPPVPAYHPLSLLFLGIAAAVQVSEPSHHAVRGLISVARLAGRRVNDSARGGAGPGERPCLNLEGEGQRDRGTDADGRPL